MCGAAPSPGPRLPARLAPSSRRRPEPRSLGSERSRALPPRPPRHSHGGRRRQRACAAGRCRRGREGWTRRFPGSGAGREYGAGTAAAGGGLRAGHGRCGSGGRGPGAGGAEREAQERREAREGWRGCLRERAVTAQGNGLTLRESAFALDNREKSLCIRAVRPWHRLPREAVVAPCLQVPKAGLDGLGASWHCGSCPCPWNEMGSGVPFQPKLRRDSLQAVPAAGALRAQPGGPGAAPGAAAAGLGRGAGGVSGCARHGPERCRRRLAGGRKSGGYGWTVRTDGRSLGSPVLFSYRISVCVFLPWVFGSPA